MIRSFHVDIDITGQVDLPGKLHTQITVYLPDRASMPERPIVVFAFPGGGAARGVFCMEAPTTTEYSQARWHAERGIVFVACDHLGTGGSTQPDPATFHSPHLMAWANDATVRNVVAMLAADTLSPGYGPVVDPFLVGVGHSMGGNLMIVLQAHREPFDAIAILGYSAFHTVLPAPPHLELKPPRRPPRMHPADGRDLSQEDHDWETISRYMNRWDADEAVEMKQHAWTMPLASRTMPPAVFHMNAAGIVAEEASWIDVPLFLGFGERDVTRNAWEEPRYYWRANDITFAVIPRMSHGMNSASTRRLLWERLQYWMHGVASLPRYGEAPGATREGA